MIRIVSLMALILTACSPSVEYDRTGPVPRLIYVPADVTEAQFAYIQTAVEAYHGISGHVVFDLRMAVDMSATGCVIRVSFHDDLGGVVVTDPETGESRELRRLGRFVTNPEQCYGRLLLHVDAISDQTVIQHELGHSIGLKHSANTADIMYDRRVGGQSLQSYVRGYVESLPIKKAGDDDDAVPASEHATVGG